MRGSESPAQPRASDRYHEKPGRLANAAAEQSLVWHSTSFVPALQEDTSKAALSL
jgi:hypothetical protein